MDANPPIVGSLPLESSQQMNRGFRIGAGLLVLIMIARIAVIQPLTSTVYIGLSAHAVMAVLLWIRWRFATRILLIWFSLAVIGGCVAATHSRTPTWTCTVMAGAGVCMLSGWWFLLKRAISLVSQLAATILILVGHALGLLYLPVLLQPR